MLTIKAMTGGETYAAHHLSNNDYYSVGETVTGQWMGRGAQMLGLEGTVTLEQFAIGQEAWSAFCAPDPRALLQLANQSFPEMPFLPAALEIVETPPSPVGRATAATIGLVFCTALLWAWWGTIDIVASATGLAGAALRFAS